MLDLHEFVDWFRTDIVYKAPEQWPGRIDWFLATIKERYEPVEARETR